MNFVESPEETAQVKSATGPGVGMGYSNGQSLALSHTGQA